MVLEDDDSVEIGADELLQLPKGGARALAIEVGKGIAGMLAGIALGRPPDPLSILFQIHGMYTNAKDKAQAELDRLRLAEAETFALDIEAHGFDQVSDSAKAGIRRFLGRKKPKEETCAAANMLSVITTMEATLQRQIEQVNADADSGATILLGVREEQGQVSAALKEGRIPKEMLHNGETSNDATVPPLIDETTDSLANVLNGSAEKSAIEESVFAAEALIAAAVNLQSYPFQDVGLRSDQRKAVDAARAAITIATTTNSAHYQIVAAMRRFAGCRLYVKSPDAKKRLRILSQRLNAFEAECLVAFAENQLCDRSDDAQDAYHAAWQYVHLQDLSDESREQLGQRLEHAHSEKSLRETL